jgi:hydroxymethylpyrimidine pyrophosphatase-like HAD family hydrolase
MGYSSREERDALLAHFDQAGDIAKAPTFVLDIDGNIAVGYNVKDRAQPLTLSEHDDPKTQNIPAGSDIAAFKAKGMVEPVIFANKSRDVRLPKALVEAINQRVEAGDPFSITLLTSRNYADVEYILKQSGVKKPEMVTGVADSGNLLHFNGASQEVRTLSAPEQQFLKEVEPLANGLNDAIRAKLTEAGKDTADMPGLFIEPKGAATNIHYRDLFSKYDLSETEEPGAAIKALIEKALKAHVDACTAPKEPDGRPVFKMGPGPMTVEITLASVTKANGLQALVNLMKTQGRKPSLVVFAGDDCYKNEKGADGAWVTKGHGTDWHAMKLANAMPNGFVIHTHHPVGNDLHGTAPDPAKAIPAMDTLDGSAPVRADLITATPLETSGLVVEAVRRMEKAQTASAPGDKLIQAWSETMLQDNAGK